MGDSIYHYTYLIEDMRPEHPTKRLYMGVRSSRDLPEDDSYMGSSTDIEFKNALRNRSKDFKKYILRIFNTREAALLSEVAYHHRMDVAEHPLFWNKRNECGSFQHGSGCK
jgi:hypothetical protein